MIALKSHPVHAKRVGPTLLPNRSRVLLRPFYPTSDDIARRIVALVMALPDKEVSQLMGEVMDEFDHRHVNAQKMFRDRFVEVRHYLGEEWEASAERRALVGSFFSHEYSLESTALFNPSIVLHPDQSGLQAGELRFILSLRATGEGHISSITFREGIISEQNIITITPPVPFVTEPELTLNTVYDKALFSRELQEVNVRNDFSQRVLNQLRETFFLDDLHHIIEAERRNSDSNPAIDMAARRILLLAESNYEVNFVSGTEISQRIIFPSTASQRNGIEDARFVRFANEDGTYTYYATYTAYDGKNTIPQLLQTSNFIHFKFSTLNGPAVQNKGMALFPRKINDVYAMLSRQDDENILIMFSNSIHFWENPMLLLSASQPWEFFKIGNCGSPIETEAGWLVISHGVGAMRKYCLGAFLLDLKDPSRVIGRLREPFLCPNESERDGYVPNVVYTCGALLNGRELVIPYAMSDSATTFATVSLDELLHAME
jgi:predicted GH43/DUF377 family glycosyl hydrolase